jgi:RNA methyltransferase, TrmH family
MTETNGFGRDRLDVEATLAEVKKLQIDRKYRDASGLFYVEGVRNFIKANDYNLDLRTILFSEKLLTAPIARKLVRHARRSGINCISLTP